MVVSPSMIPMMAMHSSSIGEARPRDISSKMIKSGMAISARSKASDYCLPAAATDLHRKMAPTFMLSSSSTLSSWIGYPGYSTSKPYSPLFSSRSSILKSP